MINIEDFKKYGQLDLLAKQVVEGFITGQHRSPFHGFSVEFAEHKLYNHGESTRHLDWKVLAKTDKLFTKRYEEETNLRAHFFLDISSSMYYPSEQHHKVLYGVMAVASLSYLLLRQRDAFSLSLFHDEIVYQSAMKSTTNHWMQIIAQLEKACIKPNEESHGTSLVKNLHLLANQMHQRSLVVLLSDLVDSESNMEELQEALRHLKHQKHEVIVFHLKEEQTEWMLDFPNRPTEFTDVETGQKVKLNPLNLRDSFQKESQRHLQELQDICGMLHIDFVPTEVNQPIEQTLLAYMAKRSKLH